MLLAGEDILNGTGDGYFSPETKVTRSQFVQMLSKFSGEDCSAYTTDEFADVGSGDWYAPAVAWAVEHGITTGSGNGLFSPNAPITRQDMAVMLQRYVEKVAKEELPQENAILEFTDASSIAVYAKDAVAAMQTAGIINGISDGGSYRFAPEAQGHPRPGCFHDCGAISCALRTGLIIFMKKKQIRAIAIAAIALVFLGLGIAQLKIEPAENSVPSTSPGTLSDKPDDKQPELLR